MIKNIPPESKVNEIQIERPEIYFGAGKAPNKHKKIMVNFMENNADSEIYSNELKKQAGFGKDGEKGFDGAITNLMMQTYLCNCDFKKRDAFG